MDSIQGKLPLLILLSVHSPVLFFPEAEKVQCTWCSQMVTQTWTPHSFPCFFAHAVTTFGRKKLKNRWLLVWIERFGARKYTCRHRHQVFRTGAKRWEKFFFLFLKKKQNKLITFPFHERSRELKNIRKGGIKMFSLPVIDLLAGLWCPFHLSN